jgi:hypothetical protein
MEEERFEQFDEDDVQEVPEAPEFVMGPMIQVVLDADDEPIVFPFSDLGHEAGDPGMVADNDLTRIVEDWLILERHVDIAPGTLAGYKVTRPETGNVTISRPAVFGGQCRWCW